MAKKDYLTVNSELSKEFIHDLVICNRVGFPFNKFKREAFFKEWKEKYPELLVLYENMVKAKKLFEDTLEETHTLKVEEIIKLNSNGG